MIKSKRFKTQCQECKAYAVDVIVHSKEKQLESKCRKCGNQEVLDFKGEQE